MRLDVVFEGDGFDEFLYSAGDLSLVAPGVCSGELGGDGFEKVDDLGEAGFVFFGDVGREGGVDCSDSKVQITSGYGFSKYGV